MVFPDDVPRVFEGVLESLERDVSEVLEKV